MCRSAASDRLSLERSYSWLLYLFTHSRRQHRHNSHQKLMQIRRQWMSGVQREMCPELVAPWNRRNHSSRHRSPPCHSSHHHSPHAGVYSAPRGKQPCYSSRRSPHPVPPHPHPPPPTPHPHPHPTPHPSLQPHRSHHPNPRCHLHPHHPDQVCKSPHHHRTRAIMTSTAPAPGMTAVRPVNSTKKLHVAMAISPSLPETAA